ncbi:hypothetical protein R3W88_026803 [Solanum pinnatisectum]|uniref:Uncharacterized protein n=1 Tax=Solanum pinnatisectum TaxID=50273 RepID=A0AAV9LGX6_9SOLN|nr:hypothetical protein R3W88_026803 [Solanum pinnatisectum]
MNTNKETRREDPETDRNEPLLVPNTGYNNQLGVVHPAETTTMHEEDMLMQRNGNEQCAIDQNANIRAPKNSSEETQSSNFSFGIKDNLVSITPISVSGMMQDTNEGKDGRKSGQEQQQIEQTRQGSQAKGKEVQIGQSTHQNAMQLVTTNTDAHLHNVVNMQFSKITVVSKQQEQDIGNHEEHWQIQKRRQNRNHEQANPKTMWRPVSPQHKSTKESKQLEPAHAGISSTIHTHNIYTNLEMQEPQDRNRSRELTHVLHEVVDRDLKSDFRAPASPLSNQDKAGQQETQEENDKSIATGKQNNKANNKSGGRLSKKKRDAIKKRQHKEQEQGPTHEGQQEQVVNMVKKGRPMQDDYGAVNSEDKVDPDNQSIDELDAEEEEVSNHLIRAFGSTFHDECPAEIQEVTEQQGLSPRGRKQSACIA